METREERQQFAQFMLRLLTKQFFKKYIPQEEG